MIIQTKMSPKTIQKSDPLVAIHTSDRNERKITDTDTTKVNSPHKLLTNREIPAIIQGVIPLVNKTTAGGIATSRKDLHVLCAVFQKEIEMGATCSAAGLSKDCPVVNWKDTGGKIPVDRNTVRIPPRTTTQVCTSTGTSFPTISIGRQKI